MPHADPDDPPRRRANKAKGHGSWEKDRPPVCGVVGRESGRVRLTVLRRSGREQLEPKALGATEDGTVVNTDQWKAYDHLAEQGRPHPTVNHAPHLREWARDDDGDGVREVHCNTGEGLWTGLRNFPRPFRGVSKWFLDQYVAMFEWRHNIKTCTLPFLQALLGRDPTTKLGPGANRSRQAAFTWKVVRRPHVPANNAS